MVNLKKVKIKDHCEITSSKRIFADEYLSEGVPFYRGKEISEKQRSSAEVGDMIYISKDKFEEIKSKYGVPQCGDLLLTSVGTIGNPYLVKENEEFYFKDGNLTWFRNFDMINSRWLYYWLLSPQGKSELNKCTIGSSQKAYTINLLYGLQIELPDLPTQTRIASVLSAYDDLIENNEKRIKALEEMAQLLYTEWFVKFKFPKHEKVKMIESGTEYGVVPEGWEVVKIDDLYETSSGGTPSRRNEIEFYLNGTIPWVKTKELNDNYILDTEEKITELAVKKSSAKMFPKNTVLIAMYGATIGKLGILSNEATTNQACCALLLKEKEYSSYYIFQFLKNSLKKIISLAFGAAQPNISQNTVKNIEILKPTKDVLELYNNKIELVFDEILSLQKQNNNLSKTRDLLIPQLVTGRKLLK
ncbi:hypothetical protein A2335_01935 [Candidatus Peregrinibacteria bacterium RIFOXYB2_FULL_32_7]|nr:MAG: hypothetical protein A2335_01935 [Candidatus Peregrinibacteria bacterium RIFOXYB2_FULL_32_7]